MCINVRMRVYLVAATAAAAATVQQKNNSYTASERRRHSDAKWNARVKARHFWDIKHKIYSLSPIRSTARSFALLLCSCSSIFKVNSCECLYFFLCNSNETKTIKHTTKFCVFPLDFCSFRSRSHSHFSRFVNRCDAMWCGAYVRDVVCHLIYYY